MSLTALFKELCELELQAFKLRENTFKTTTKGATQLYEECLERELARIKSLKEEIEKLKKRCTEE
jgi:hypothetical protein